MKKVTSVLIVLLTVLGFVGFAACGGGEENGTVKTHNGDTTPQAKEELSL